MKRAKILIASILATFGLLFAGAIPANAASGGCWPSGISSANYGKASAYPVVIGGKTYKQYHLSMTAASPYSKWAIYVSGTKVSSGEEVYSNWTTASRYVHFRWAKPGADNPIFADCGFYL